VPTVPLPDNPSLEQLRKQAKDLRDQARAGVDDALDLVAAHHPSGAHPLTLTGAQLVLARCHGFASWAQLKRYLEMIERYRRTPDEVDEGADPAGQFLALACLRYGEDDHPTRWERAARLLAQHPDLAGSNIFVAAATADEAAIAGIVGADPGAAAREGGPHDWQPILYLAYARHDPELTEEATLGAARLLLRYGADANAGYLWHGLGPGFTALTGALGGGESDQPPHPHGYALASLLLEAGADPNDSQALYNRQFGSDDGHLILLLEKGLGRGDGGPWRRRLGPMADSPSELVRIQLWWAIVHGMTERVKLLVEHDADFLSPFGSPSGPGWAGGSDGRSPAEVAALNGSPELCEWLVERGAPRPRGTGVDGLIAAAMAGDRAKVARRSGHIEAARAERPALIVWAAARGARDAVALLAEIGFDVNALGRGDVPMEQQWETALHRAAASGDVELARLLLDLGAEPTITDARFHSTPLGWARHFGHPAIVELLQPRTP